MHGKDTAGLRVFQACVYLIAFEITYINAFLSCFYTEVPLSPLPRRQTKQM